MDIPKEHIIEKKSTSIILGALLVLSLIIMVIGGNQLYNSKMDNSKIEAENKRLSKNIVELNKREKKLKAETDKVISDLDKKVKTLKDGFTEQRFKINEETTALINEVDSIEFYPLYVRLSDAGGAIPKD